MEQRGRDGAGCGEQEQARDRAAVRDECAGPVAVYAVSAGGVEADGGGEAERGGAGLLGGESGRGSECAEGWGCV